MFRRTLLIGVALLLLTGSLLTYLLVRTTPSDLAGYHDLLRKARPEEMTAALAKPGQQQRQIVYKDLWIIDGRDRLHFQLACQASTLEFSVKNGGADIVEHMRDITGIIQERLFYLLPDGTEIARSDAPTPDPSWRPMQELRFLEAERASYHYATNRFVTQEATLTRFRAKGHDMLETLDGLDPLITGTARSAEFCLAEGGIDFKAHHLRAKIYSNGGGLL